MGLLISAKELRKLRELDKPMRATWIEYAIGEMKENGPNLQCTLDVRELTTGPTRGQFTVYLRQHVTTPESFSVGLCFTPIGEVDSICLVRANGPHGHPHTVRMGGCRWTFAGVPHIHYCTESALRMSVANPKRWNPETFAVATGEYRDLKGAARAVARRANLTYQRSFDDIGDLARI